MNIKIKPILFTLLGLGLLGPSLSSHAAESSFSTRADVKPFVEKMVTAHHFDRSTLHRWLNAVTLQPSIIEAMSKPAEKLPWYRYEGLFLTSKRIEEGVLFWKDNQNALAHAERVFGVPPEIIVAIVGVETFYGKNTGRYSVLDSLATLGFTYPPRAAFFLSELEEFLVLAREQAWDPTQIKGSYAGAMGKGQFIASSYRRYAIDFTGDGKRDLLENNADIIGSIAYYFKENGWQTNQPVIFPARIDAKHTTYQSIIASKMNPQPEHTLQRLAEHHVYPATPLAAEWEPLRFALVGLETESGPQYWLGAQNFYTITRYNRSDHYAMAVYNLSQAIKTAYQKEGDSVT